MKANEQLLKTLKVFTPSTTSKLESFGINTAQDALLYFPKKYLDFSQIKTIKDLSQGQVVTIKAQIKSISSRFSFKTRRTHSEALVSDHTGFVKVVWFNQGYIAKTLQKGQTVYLSGKVEYYKGLTLVSPTYELLETDQIHTGRLVPVYKLPDKIYDKSFRKGINSLLKLNLEVEESLPSKILNKRKLPGISQCLKELHFPSSKTELTQATKRLAYEDSLVQQLAMELNRIDRAKFAAKKIPFNLPLLKLVLKKLPFSLTPDQKKALWQILQDLEHKEPMNRLLLGDVGSGKTIVALLAAIETYKSNLTTAFLVPTEILATQHFQNFISLFVQFGFPTKNLVLLTSGHTKVGEINSTKQEVQKKLNSNSGKIVIGTHALLEEKIKFKNLNLIVIDEQHRFGVNQRKKLLKQIDGLDEKSYTIPHLLSMSATPIPRTLALSIYSDLDVSFIENKPANRLPIKTWVIPENKRFGAYKFIEEEVKKGRQVFILTPLVEESDLVEAKAVKNEYLKLKNNIFPTYSLGLLHGSLKSSEKERVMQEFKSGKTQILVATSVIEVGIDIPNASVMLIENAERFGLAQLHQLRGRIGRGTEQSYCLIFTDKTEQKVQDRLHYFATHENGFELAEYDLKTRGFGSLFGSLQTGFEFKYPEFLNQKILREAKEDANYMLKKSPTMKNYPLLMSLATALSDDLHLE